MIAAYKEFNAENPDGVITKEQFLLTMKVLDLKIFKVLDLEISHSFCLASEIFSALHCRRMMMAIFEQEKNLF